MKKIISILFMLALFGAYGFAQITDSHEVDSKLLRAGETYYKWTGTQTIGGVTQDTAYWELQTNKNVPTNCNVRVTFTREGTTDDYDSDLQGKLFDGSTYEALIESDGNIVSFELTDTTTFTGDIGALPDTFYRYYRVYVADDDDCAETDSIIITSVEFKLYER